MIAVDGQWVCADCIFFIANGDLPEDPEAAAAVIAGCDREAEAGGQWVSASSEDEFSCSPCDCCGSTLGGPRYAATVLYPDEEASEE